MDKKESVELYRQGVTAWNFWVDEMFVQRAKLKEIGEWLSEVDSAGKVQGKNLVTQDWLTAAMSDFSDYHFREADFTKFVFPGQVTFNRAEFPYEVRFNGARFEGHAEFNKTTFPGSVGFSESMFSADAWFKEVRFASNVSFNNAIFSRNAVFQEAEFDSAEFKNAKFSGDGCFREAMFSKRAMFDEATFIGNADFFKAKFSGLPVFYKTKFLGNTKFRSAVFKSHAVFNKATFTGKGEFSEAEFAGNALFDEAMFQDNVIFNRAIFRSSTSFRRTVFQKDASFVAMTGQSFFTLENALFFLVPDFGQAHFEEAPRLDNSHFGMVPVELSQLGFLRPTSVKPDVTACWRALKRLALQGHDHERELNFLAEEIKSRRGVQDWPLPNPLSFREGDPICWPGGGRYWAGLLYQWFSDFGRSVARPFLGWVVITAAFAFYFHNASPHSHPASNNLLPITLPNCSGDPMTAALYLSVHNGLVFSGLSRTEKLAQSYTCLYGSDEKEGYSPKMPDPVVFAGLAQTILSAALIFLFLLALRNYFRIK